MYGQLYSCSNRFDVNGVVKPNGKIDQVSNNVGSAVNVVDKNFLLIVFVDTNNEGSAHWRDEIIL